MAGFVAVVSSAPPDGPLVLPSCCRVRWAMVVLGGRLRLCGGARTPSWWGVLRWCVPPLMVGRGVVVDGPPHGRACCGGVRPPSWVALCVVVVCGPPHVVACCLGCSVLCYVAFCVVVVSGPPYGGAFCVGVSLPSWRGLLW